MKCPFCSNLETRVVDSRYVAEIDSIRRRRECAYCNERFTTYERVATSPLVVKKKDGRREPFSDEKLQNGILLACRKRPLSPDDINRIVKEVTARLREMDANEVESPTIGNFVMDALLEVDEVAYIRFASVYKEFDDIQGFVRAIERIMSEKEQSGGIEDENKEK